MSEENKLLKQRIEDRISKKGLVQEAEADGFTEEEAMAIVDSVISRAKESGKGKNGGAFGVRHDPNDRLRAIKNRITTLTI